MKLRILFSALIVTALPALAEDCKTEKYEVVNNVTINADRCDGALQVKSLGVTNRKNRKGEDLTVISYSFSHRYHNRTFMWVRFSDPKSVIDPETVVGDVIDELKADETASLRQKHSDWQVTNDQRRDWAGDGSGSDFPSRTVEWRLASYLDKDVNQYTQPEFHTIQVIADKHNNCAYILESHFWMPDFREDQTWRSSMHVSWQNR